MNPLLQEYIQTLEGLWYEFSETAALWTYNVLRNNQFLWVAEIIGKHKILFKLREEDYEFRKEITNRAYKWKQYIVDSKTFEINFNL